jgi:hypothetical protein
MAAGENELEPVVRQFVVVAGGCRGFTAVQRVGDVSLGRVESRAAADRVDCLETRGGDQPGARVRWPALDRPALQGGAERVVHRILGQVEAAEQADERGADATGLCAINGVELVAKVDRRWLGHGRKGGIGKRLLAGLRADAKPSVSQRH